MSESEGSSIPPHSPPWMADLLGRIDKLVESQRELLKLYRDLYDSTHDLIAGQRREIDELQRRATRAEARADDAQERIGKLEVILRIGADTERPPPDPMQAGG